MFDLAYSINGSYRWIVIPLLLDFYHFKTFFTNKDVISSSFVKHL